MIRGLPHGNLGSPNGGRLREVPSADWTSGCGSNRTEKLGTYVLVGPDAVRVVFFTHSCLGQQAIYRLLDTFKKGG